MENSSSITILRNLAYGNDSSSYQLEERHDDDKLLVANRQLDQNQTSVLSKNRLDLFLPNLSTSNYQLSSITKPPLVIFVHGGGWRRGDRQQWKHFLSSYDTNLLFAFIFRVTKLFDNIGETFAQNGAACAIISYPLQQPHILVTIFELFTSFCMSTIFSIGLFAFMILLLQGPLLLFSNLTGAGDFYQYYDTKASVIQLCLILSQILIWTVIILNLKNYRHGLPKVITCSIPIGLLAHGTLFLFNITTSWTCSLLLVVFLQSSICASQVYHHLSSKKITCDDQITAVAESVTWLQTFGAKTKMFDCNKIVLVGHSAGSHLINMLIWNGKYLQGTKVTKNDVKGIISLSGVHNLDTINRSLTRHLYLSTLRSDHDIHKELSPINLVTMSNSNSSPEFLIINAEQDFNFLKKDGRDYAKRLETNGYKVHYAVIPSCNHLSLPMNFGRLKSNSKLTAICMDFVKKIT